MEIDRILNEIRDYVQECREEGNTDLRSILHVIDKFIKDNNYTLKDDL